MNGRFKTWRGSFGAVLMLLATGLCATAKNACAAEPADYKIAFWYLRSDPLNSMRHKVYDVHAGQYTPAVDAWLKLMKEQYPAYDAYIKELRIDPARGESATKQVATAVLEEYRAKAGPYMGFGIRDSGGIYGGSRLSELLSPGPSPVRPTPRPSSSVSAYMRGYGFVTSPGANRPPAFLNPSPVNPPSPFPYPYVRPHP